MSNFKIGERVRLLFEVTTIGGITHPVGSPGVITSGGSLCCVDMDSGTQLHVKAGKLEAYTPVFANHYNPVLIGDDTRDPPDTDDAHDYTPATKDTALSGDELMNITRSFCR